MSDSGTKKLLETYREQNPQIPGFFTSLFTPKYFKSEAVTIDIVRSGQTIAPVLPDFGAGLNRSGNQGFTSKDYVPAVYGEEFAIPTHTLLKRQAGQDNFKDPAYMQALLDGFRAEIRVREEKIRRAIEIQCSQVLRLGTLNLPDASGALVAIADFQPKVTHAMVGVTNDWDLLSGTTRLADVQGAADTIKKDSGLKVDRLYAGGKAMASLLADPAVLQQTAATGTKIGQQVPPRESAYGIYHGVISVGNHQLELWTSDQFYINAAGSAVNYLGDWEVIVASSQARLDLAFGDIPNEFPDPRVAGLGIGRLSGGSMDLITNAWVSPNGRNIMGSVEARPLAIPVAIDGFASINTKVT